MLDTLLLTLVLLGIAGLATSRVDSCMRLMAVQGVILGVLLLIVHSEEMTWRLVGLASVTIVLKGVVVPWALLRSIRTVGARREVEPYVGFGVSVVLGALAFGAAFFLTSYLPALPDVQSRLLVPVALALCFIGLLFLVTRKMAIAQVIGYLVLENGIFVFSLGLAHALPASVEMGVLLDVFVGALVLGITVNSINQEFDHIDANRLQQLHDLPTPRELAARRRAERR